MKATAKLFGLLLVLLLGQSLVIEALPDAVRPDLVLIFALAMGLRVGSGVGLLLAFLSGFAIDVLSGAPVGLFALLRGTACVATRAFDGALYLRAPGPWGLYVAGYTVADLLLMGLCLHWFVPQATLPWGALLLRSPGTAVVTALVAAPLLQVFRRIDADPGRESGFGFVMPDIRS